MLKSKYVSSKLALSALLALSLFALNCIIPTHDAFAERKRKEVQDSKPKRKYVHPCPAGTEQFGSAPPVARKVYCRQPVVNGYRLHGSFVSYHQSGEKRVEGEFHSGRKHGRWTTYHRNGEKKYVEEWQDGKRKERLTYDPKGSEVPEIDRRAQRLERRKSEKWRYSTETQEKKAVRRKRKSTWVKGGSRRRVKLLGATSRLRRKANFGF